MRHETSAVITSSNQVTPLIFHVPEPGIDPGQGEDAGGGGRGLQWLQASRLISSTSKVRVALGGMIPGCPLLP